MIKAGRFVTIAFFLVVLRPADAVAQICLPLLCSGPPSVGPVDFPHLPSLPLGLNSPPPSIPPPPPGCPDATEKMKILVISADGTETVLPAIQQALDYHSVPYATWIATQR